VIQVKKTALHTCMGLFFTFATCLAAYPQVTGGTFSGTVTDSSGAVIPAV
jgi:hypothetical protein